MARQTLYGHRKFLRLARALGSKALAVGSLELIWSHAYESGDDRIGDAEDLEMIADWNGEAGALASALLTAGGASSSGFVEDRQGVLFVHDLWDHAPRYVKDRAEREAARERSGKTLSQVRAESGRRGGEVSCSRKSPEANEQQVEANERSFADLDQQMSTKCAANPAPQQSGVEKRVGIATSNGIPVVVDPSITGRDVGEGSPTGLFDLSTINGSNGHHHEPRKVNGTSSTIEAELAWRIERVWAVHVKAWKAYRKERSGVEPRREPALHPKDIRLPIRQALLAYDRHLLGPEDRERWERESVARAAGVGIFYDPFLTAKSPDNDLANGGREYLEHWRPWRPQRGKADPVQRFAEAYFAIKEARDVHSERP